MSGSQPLAGPEADTANPAGGLSPLDRASSLTSRRHFIIGAAMAAAVGVAQARMPRQVDPRVPKAVFEKWVPKTVGPWRFRPSSDVVLPPPDALSDRLYDNLVACAYEAADKPAVMIAIAYNNIQSGVLQVHRPEICYPAGGYKLTPTRPVDIAGHGGPIAANTFSATGYGNGEQVLYWTRVGTDFPRSWADQRLAVIRANLGGRIPDGMLARFSILSDDPDGALGVLGEFVRGFELAATPQLRRLLVGS